MMRASSTAWLSLFVASCLVANAWSFLAPLPSHCKAGMTTRSRSLSPSQAIAPSGLQTPDNKDLYDMTIEEVVEMHEAVKRQRLSQSMDQEGRRAKSRQLSGGLAPFQALTQSQAFMAVEAASFALSLGLIASTWGADWAADGYVAYSTQEAMRSACMMWGVERMVSAGLSGAVAWFKGREVAPNALRTLLVGGIDFARVALLDDKATLEERALEDQPPLSMEINTLKMAATHSPTGILLSTTIRTLPGKEHVMRRHLTQMMEQMKPRSKLLSTMAINQDPDDRTTFMMLQRFPSMQAMSAWQADQHYQEFTALARDLLREPMGLYVTNERRGRLTEPNYPFGPGGEGGRDDSIYSSPTNLDGSQAGVQREIMAA